jgi:polyferredoxin
MVAGILVRYRRTRPWRVFFLLGAVVFLGFVREPCPCMISSFENTVLMASGAEVQWIHLLWFLALIPITYIFGRVFCGWICHLGAIQELLYRPGRLRILTSKSAIRYMKISQYVLFFGLIIQLLVQQKIFWCTIDPFLSIFQLMLARKYEILSVFLIALILISSVLSFRPFCRAACPIGLVLGWIEKIPGASVVGITNKSCVSCINCSNACKTNAILRENKQILVDNAECIMCGDCLDSCNKDGMKISRK